MPGSLKVAYSAIAAGSVAYFLLSTKIAPGQTLDAAGEASGNLMFAVVALVVIYGLIEVAFSFGKPQA